MAKIDANCGQQAEEIFPSLLTCTNRWVVLCDLAKRLTFHKT